MQVYRGMDIGTAKPDRDLLAALPHHLIGVVDPDQQFDVGEFVGRADVLVEQIAGRGNVPLLCGGTAFYLKHFLHGLPGTPPGDSAIREQLRREAETDGLQALFAELERVDPEYAARISSHDPVRIMRGLEIFRLSGRKVSSFRLSGLTRKPYRCLLLGLFRPQQELYNRIDNRVESMFARGLVNEIKELLRKGYRWQDPGFKGIGYREFRFMQMGCLSLAGVKERIKRDTRRYAKRQLTFFRSLASVRWHRPDDVRGVESAIDGFLADRPQVGVR